MAKLAISSSFGELTWPLKGSNNPESISFDIWCCAGISRPPFEIQFLCVCVCVLSCHL